MLYTCGYIRNVISQDNEIYGASNVGGIIGGALTNSSTYGNALPLYNSYTNSKVEAKIDNAGGLVGYINNSKTNNKSYVSKIYNNYVACSEISSPKNAGGLIGKLEKPIYYLNDKTKYYYGNLVVSNISEEYPIGNIDELYETYIEIKEAIDPITGEIITEEVNITKKVEPEVTKSRLFDSLFYQYEIQDGKKALEKSKLDTLKLQSTYKDILKFDLSKYDYLEIDKIFPKLKNVKDENIITFNDGEKYTFVETGINLPDEMPDKLTLDKSSTTFLLNSYLKESLPEYVIYTSGVNKINIEFSKADNNQYFKYETVKNGVSEKIPIKERTYTFEYDFNSEFKIIVGNNEEEKEEIITPDNIKKRISAIDGKYYYLEGETLKSNSEEIEGNYINIFNENALTTNGYIYSLKDNKKGSKITEGLTLLKETIPIAEYVYSNSIIETYYNYSKVIKEEENIIEYQIFIKNGELFVLDGELEIYADSVVVDSYNNKEYQAILGKDGIIYNLKEQISYPQNFENQNIIQMTNNINSERTEILIMYDTGRIYAFNYVTGTILYDSENIEFEEESIISNITSLFEQKENELYNIDKENYKEAISLQEKLIETPIELAQKQLNEVANIDYTQESDNSGYNNETENKENINTSQNTETYTTVYDAKTNSYLVYKTSDLLNSNKEEIVSETEKIYSTPGLKEYYNLAQTDKHFKENKGIYFIIISIISILGILVIMYRKKNYQ